MTHPQGFPPPGGQGPHGGPQQYGNHQPNAQQQNTQPQNTQPQNTQPQNAQQFGPPTGPPAGQGPGKKRRALPIVIGAIVVVVAVLAVVLVRASMVVGGDDYDRADNALTNLDLKRDQLTSAMNDATTAATGGKAPGGAVDVEGLRADLAEARDSGAERDSAVAEALDRIDPALDQYADAVQAQQRKLEPLASMVAACDSYVDQHPMITETATEASVSTDIAECEKATKAAASEEGLAELQQAYTEWIQAQKQTGAAYEEYAASRDLTAYERAVDIEATGNEKVTKVTTGPAVKKLAEPVPQRSEELGAAIAEARKVIAEKR